MLEVVGMGLGGVEGNQVLGVAIPIHGGIRTTRFRMGLMSDQGGRRWHFDCLCKYKDKGDGSEFRKHHDIS